MCGILAARTISPRIDAVKVDRALHTLAHRGPDGRGHWFSCDRRTLLGHTRLSIIGLDNGEQPIVSPDGRLALVVNGEFYGYRAIRERLQAEGAVFRTESDSEIALHLYRRHGRHFVQHLRGEFALVLWDAAEETLIAVRDRFGIKPLFHAERNGDLFLASEAKAMFALGFEPRWHIPGLVAELAMLRSTDTPFADARSVPPGSMLVARDGEIRIERYWDLHYPPAATLAADRRSDAEVIEGFRAALEDAVAERLVADVEVACYLSGGLDSSAVLGIAQAGTDRPIRAFTIAFSESAFDEAPLAERTAAHVGSTYEPVPVSAQDLADHWSDATWHAERMIFNGNAVAKYLLSKAVRDAGIKVVFTGEGSDEILAGYPGERRDLARYGDRTASAAEIAARIDALIAANPVSRGLMFPTERPAPWCELVRQQAGFCPSWIEAMSTQYAWLIGLARPEVAAELDPATPYRTIADELDLVALADRDAVNLSLYIWQKTALPNFILTLLGDRMEMAHSIEGRVPFLDHHVAEYAAAMPVRHKIRDMREKHVLREAAKDVLTPEIYARQKHPFVSPPLRQTADPLRIRTEEILRDPSFAGQPLFDPARIETELDRLADLDIETYTERSRGLMMVASLALMQQRFAIAA
jgi:asparagine synthase (glutamine-hydrolysing)